MPRRHRRPGGREQAAERTRQKILDAAKAEFGAKGYRGARTAGIAARAGVNQQLIAYYFGGKQGLLDELRRRWSARRRAPMPPGGYAESLAAYLDMTLDDIDWARMIMWQALGDDPGEGAADARSTRARDVAEGVARVRDRQRAGELTGAVSAEFIVLLSYMTAFAPVALPDIVSDILGVAPGSQEYRRLCTEQLTSLLGATGPCPPSSGMTKPGPASR